jgi:hypothetical protein
MEPENKEVTIQAQLVINWMSDGTLTVSGPGNRVAFLGMLEMAKSITLNPQESYLPPVPLRVQ